MFVYKLSVGDLPNDVIIVAHGIMVWCHGTWPNDVMFTTVMYIPLFTLHEVWYTIHTYDTCSNPNTRGRGEGSGWGGWVL